MLDFARASNDLDRGGLRSSGPHDQPIVSDVRQRHLKVLVIDDDQGAIDTFALALRLAGFEVTTAESGVKGLDTAKRHRFDCVVTDLRLGDMTGIDVLRALSSESNKPPFIVISAWLSTIETVQATKLGAFDVLEKPVTGERLIAVIEAAVTASHQPSTEVRRAESDRPPGSVAERWAAYVIRGCRSESDLNTLERWARESAVSYSTLCEICRLNGIRPLDARDFVRVLRALKRACLVRCTPEVFLAVADRRTVRALSIRSGVDLETEVDAESISEFMKYQRLIPNECEAFLAVRHLLTD